MGKSLAYLLPLALYSRGGRRSVVATRTVTLQEQLMERDLPMVEALLGAPVPAALLKGRNHQLSLRRWQRFLASPDSGPHGPDLDRVRFKLKLLAWLAETERGDRGELHLNGHEEVLWRHVESDGGDCLGAACANWQDNRCFMVAARRTAEAASIVITNHALLLADAAAGGQALGEHDALVIDEAHHLESAATEQLGVSLRAVRRAGRARPARRRRGRAGRRRSAAAREATARLFGDVKGRIGEVLGVRPQRQRHRRAVGRGARRRTATPCCSAPRSTPWSAGGRRRRSCATPSVAGLLPGRAAAPARPGGRGAAPRRGRARGARRRRGAGAPPAPARATSPGWRCAPSRASSTRRR